MADPIAMLHAPEVKPERSAEPSACTKQCGGLVEPKGLLNVACGPASPTTIRELRLVQPQRVRLARSARDCGAAYRC